MGKEKETRWVEIPAEEVNDILSTDEGGIQLTVRMSPHDIPDAVRGKYDEGLKRFVVEFRYIEDEPWKRVQAADQPFALRIGKHSDRLVGLEVDVDGLKAAFVGVQIEPELLAEQMAGAIDRFARLGKHNRRRGSASRKRNYSVAKDALSSNRDKIFRPLPVR